jgi:antitoxin component YwqK of YwqJK toxin-antitoxin module
MTTIKIITFISTTILFSCSSADNKVNDQVVAKSITTKDYYSNGKIKSTSEMTSDSVLNGLTIWYDSLGRKNSEQTYFNGKLTGVTKSFYENGQIAKEIEYNDGKITEEKDYNVDCTFIYQNPIDIKDVGEIKVIIGNNSRNYFRKNTADTVKMFADNLPLTNKIISVKNAKLKAIGNDNYILTPLDGTNSVKIIFQLKKHKDDEIYFPIDSTTIEIK